MEIREVRDLEDLRGVDRVNRRCWTVAYDDIFPDSVLDREPVPADALRERLAEIQSWTGVALVAVEGDRVVGYAFARWGDDTKSFVDAADAGLKEIYVDPAHWNEGVGTALLRTVERRIPAAYEGLTLSMLAGNDTGRRFYEGRGFVEIGETTDVIAGETYDCVLFRKPLRNADR